MITERIEKSAISGSDSAHSHSDNQIGENTEHQAMLSDFQATMPDTDERIKIVEETPHKEAPHKMCNLKIKQVAFGTQVTFTIPKGMSGKMVLDAIERANPRPPGAGIVSPDSFNLLLKDAGLNKVVAENTEFTTTLCFDSNFRNRSEQAIYLRNKGLGFTDRWILTVAAALCKDANGLLPAGSTDIGTSKDNGDLFKGKVVRAGVGSLYTFDGIREDNFYFDVFGYDAVIAAGSPLKRIRHK